MLIYRFSNLSVPVKPCPYLALDVLALSMPGIDVTEKKTNAKATPQANEDGGKENENENDGEKPKKAASSRILRYAEV